MAMKFFINANVSHWGYKYPTSSVFEWLKEGRMVNGLDFEQPFKIQTKTFCIQMKMASILYLQLEIQTAKKLPSTPIKNP